mmetsp:Transcript_2392/g.3820  ORF Transcript_2392/g.3820 Transcript_2392/m.3820 type:complete len:237 (+) Transcript_2392:177-887(+)
MPMPAQLLVGSILELPGIAHVLHSLGKGTPHTFNVKVQPICTYFPPCENVFGLVVVALRSVEDGFLFHEVQGHQRHDALGWRRHLVDLNTSVSRHYGILNIASVGPQVLKAHDPSPRTNRTHDVLCDPTRVEPGFPFLCQRIENFCQVWIPEHLPSHRCPVGSPFHARWQEEVLSEGPGLSQLPRARVPNARRDWRDGKTISRQISRRLQNLLHGHGAEELRDVAPCSRSSRYCHI